MAIVRTGSPCDLPTALVVEGLQTGLTTGPLPGVAPHVTYLSLFWSDQPGSGFIETVV